MDIKRKPERVPARRFPDGTLYYHVLAGKRSVIKSVTVVNGRVSKLGPVPDIPAYTAQPIAAQNTKRVSLLSYEYIKVNGALKRRNPRLFSLPSGNEIPIRAQPEAFGPLMFLSFSPQERYLCFSWVNDKRDEGIVDGIGIYDSKTQQMWRQEGAVMPMWSASGQELIYARQFFNGTYFLRTKKEMAAFRDFFGLPVEKQLAHTQFFSKNVHRLGETGAKRISQAEAVRLVGHWYESLFPYALNDWENQVTTGSVVAPGHTGAILIDSRSRHQDDLGLFPNELGLDWFIRYFDAQGRTVLYAPSPQVRPMSWSRDGERIYGRTYNSQVVTLEGPALICFWVHSGKYAVVPLPEKWHPSVCYIED